jgi:hypothetical protein
LAKAMPFPSLSPLGLRTRTSLAIKGVSVRTIRHVM